MSEDAPVNTGAVVWPEEAWAPKCSAHSARFVEAALAASAAPSPQVVEVLGPSQMA